MNASEIIVTLCVICLAVWVAMTVGIMVFIKTAAWLLVVVLIVLTMAILMNYFDPENK